LIFVQKKNWKLITYKHNLKAKNMENQNAIEYLANEMSKLIPAGNESLIHAIIHNAKEMRDKENAKIIKSSFNRATEIISKEFKKFNINYHNI
jgi:methanogenic corrinoid protein MtbC1